MKIFLHIGFGKTGTTSIQDSFYKKRNELLELGVYYPLTGLRGTGHHNLASPGSRSVKNTTKLLYQQLVSEIENIDCDKVFISSEFFCFLPSVQVEHIAERLRSHETKIIFYVRNQLPLIQSTYLQWQKMGDDYKGSIERFIGMHGAGFDFMRRISPWVSAFGKESIIARVFEKQITGHDIRKDIANIVNINEEVNFGDHGYSNISLLPEFSTLISLVDQLDPRDEDRKKIINNLLSLSEKFKIASDLKLLDNKTCNKIRGKYFESNASFSKLFLDHKQADIFCWQ